MFQPLPRNRPQICRIVLACFFFFFLVSVVVPRFRHVACVSPRLYHMCVSCSGLASSVPCRHSLHTRPAMQQSDQVSLVEAPLAGGGHTASEVDDILQLAQIAQQARKRSFEQRSWAHAKHARTCRALQNAEVARQIAESSAATAAEKLRAVAAADTALARAVGIQVAPAFDVPRAMAVLRQASLPTAHRDYAAMRFQACSAHVVSRAIEHMQTEFVAGLCGRSEGDTLLGAKRFCAYTGMWDETSQRVRKFLQNRLRGETAHRGQVAAQVMMQRGAWAVLDLTENEPQVTIGEIKEKLHGGRGLTDVGGPCRRGNRAGGMGWRRMTGKEDALAARIGSLRGGCVGVHMPADGTCVSFSDGRPWAETLSSSAS